MSEDSIEEIDDNMCLWSVHVVMGMTGAHVLCSLPAGHSGLHHGDDTGNTDEGAFAEVYWEGGIAPTEGIEATIEVYDIADNDEGLDYSIARIDGRSQVSA